MLHGQNTSGIRYEQTSGRTFPSAKHQIPSSMSSYNGLWESTGPFYEGLLQYLLLAVDFMHFERRSLRLRAFN